MIRDNSLVDMICCAFDGRFLTYSGLLKKAPTELVWMARLAIAAVSVLFAAVVAAVVVY